MMSEKDLLVLQELGLFFEDVDITRYSDDEGTITIRCWLDSKEENAISFWVKEEYHNELSPREIAGYIFKRIGEKLCE